MSFAKYPKGDHDDSHHNTRRRKRKFAGNQFVDQAGDDAPLDPEVAEKILPIYQELSREDLLQRCLGGYTQNSNESLNALIWKYAPKHLHSGLETIQIAAWIAAAIFNDGFLAVLWLMQCLKIEIGKQSFDYAVFVDKRRDKKKEKRRSQSTHEARKARKDLQEQLLEEEDDDMSADEMFYAPGIAD